MKYLISIFFLLILSSKLYANNNISIFTGELAPYSYTQNKILKGFAVDIIKELKKRTNSNYNIILKPWGRVIKESTDKNMITFPIARLPYREKMYKWIGPILIDKTIFAVKKSNFKEVSTIDELKNYTVGVNLGAPTTKRLKSLNFKKLNIIPSEVQLSRMFIKGRFKLWYSTKYMIYNFLQKENFNMLDLKIMYTDLTLHMYVAASLDIDDTLINKWQNALDKMKEDGTYQTILDKHKIK